MGSHVIGKAKACYTHSLADPSTHVATNGLYLSPNPAHRVDGSHGIAQAAAALAPAPQQKRSRKPRVLRYELPCLARGPQQTLLPVQCAVR
jgi:hypothetical protein